MLAVRGLSPHVEESFGRHICDNFEVAMQYLEQFNDSGAPT